VDSCRVDLQQAFPDCSKITGHSGEELDLPIAYSLDPEEERRELSDAMHREVWKRRSYEHRAPCLLQAMADNAPGGGLPARGPTHPTERPSDPLG